jgi:hypothetical protein
MSQDRAYVAFALMKDGSSFYADQEGISPDAVGFDCGRTYRAGEGGRQALA